MNMWFRAKVLNVNTNPSQWAERGSGTRKPVRGLVIACICCFAVAAMVWLPVFIYAAGTPKGERDMGGAFLAALALFASGAAVLVGVAILTTAVVRWWLNRRTGRLAL